MATSSAFSTTNQYIKYTISITQNSQSVSGNTSNVTVKVFVYRTNTGYTTYGPGTVYCKINGTTYSAAMTASHKITNSGITIYTKTLDIPHEANGKKTLTCSAWFDHDRFTSEEQSYSQALTTIPRASSLSASNGTLNTAQNLTITRADDSFTHTITYTCGSASGTVVTKTANTTVSWTPPLSLASQNTTGTTVSVKFTLTTYSGDTKIGTATKTITCSIPSTVIPTCAVAVTDSTGYKDTYGGYIQGVSKFKVTITGTPAYGSAISSYSATANGSTYKTASFTTDVIKSSGTATIKGNVKDKRGRFGSATATATVLAYSQPKISKLSVGRCDEDGTDNDQGEYVKIKYSCSITSLSSKNTLSAVIKHKKTTETTYTTVTDIPASTTASYTDKTLIFPGDSDSSYDIELSITDKFKTTTKTTSVSTAFSFFHFAGEKSMGLGKLAELLDGLDIGFLTRFANGLKYPVLKPETDLDDVLTPNFYAGENITTYNYSNCPLTNGTFYLEVVAMGDEGQVRQRISSCSKAASVTYERIHYEDAWGEWVKVSDFGNTLLWSGSYYMTSGHTINLSEPISKQPSGIVLVFSEFIDNASSNTAFHCRFIPKMLVSKHNGVGQCVQLSSSNLDYFATKYLYVSNDKIVGHDNNGMTGTGDCGINFTNTRFILRYVIGV